MKLLILGIFLILNALGFAIYWAIGDNPHKAWVIPICIIIVIVGMFFTLHDRAIEITFKGVGKIKAAAKQATTDSEAIAEMKKRIEAQSATVDMVAQKATETKKTLKELEEITKYSKLTTAAHNDDRQAFNELLVWVDNKSSKLWESAANAAIKIRTAYSGPLNPGNKEVDWPEGIDPLKLSIEQIKSAYAKSLSLYHTDFVKNTDKNPTISKKEKMQFYVDILTNDSSLTATFYAGKYFVKEANDPKLNWSPFSIKPLMDWWEQNKHKIE